MLHLAIILQLGLPIEAIKSVSMVPSVMLTASADPRDPGKEITDDPHGPDPHGPDPHDEVHDSRMPANDPGRNPLRGRDSYGNPLPPQ